MHTFGPSVLFWWGWGVGDGTAGPSPDDAANWWPCLTSWSSCPIPSPFFCPCCFNSEKKRNNEKNMKFLIHHLLIFYKK